MKEQEQMKDKVVRLFRENPLMMANDIAEELGVTRQYVSRMLNKAGENAMQRQKDVTKEKYRRMEEDFKKYYEQGVSLKEMRELLGVPQSVVYKLQKTLDLYFLDLSDMRKVKWVNNISERKKKGMLNKDIAEEFGVSKGYISRLIKWGRDNPELVKQYNESEEHKEIMSKELKEELDEEKSTEPKN